MKKTLKTVSVVLAMFIILNISSFATSIRPNITSADIVLNTNMDKLNPNDYKDIITINTDGLVFDDMHYRCPIEAFDVIGRRIDKFEAGRTYSLHLYFTAEMPYTMDEYMFTSVGVGSNGNGNVDIVSYEVSMYNKQEANSYPYSLEIVLSVQVGGNFFVRAFGSVADFFLKTINFLKFHFSILY